jgi:hypothetical protein
MDCEGQARRTALRSWRAQAIETTRMVGPLGVGEAGRAATERVGAERGPSGAIMASVPLFVVQVNWVRAGPGFCGARRVTAAPGCAGVPFRGPFATRRQPPTVRLRAGLGRPIALDLAQAPS